MVITKLAQNKNESLVDIYLDDKFFKTVDKNFMVNIGLVKGKVLNSDEVLKLENQNGDVFELNTPEQLWEFINTKIK